MNVFKLLYLVIGGAWLVQPLPKTKEMLAEAHGSATRDAHFFINISISTEQIFFFSLKKSIYVMQPEL